MNVETHYTPKLEDLHIGFECMAYNEKKHLWYPVEVDEQILADLAGDDSAIEMTNEEFDMSGFRVKYLDDEDIESLGWNFHKGQVPDLAFGNFADVHVIYKDDKVKYILKNMSEMYNHMGPDQSALEALRQKKPTVYGIDKINGNMHRSLCHLPIRNKSELKSIMSLCEIEA